MKHYKTIGGKRYQIIVNDLDKRTATAMADKHRRAGRYTSIRIVKVMGRYGICVR